MIFRDNVIEPTGRFLAGLAVILSLIFVSAPSWAFDFSAPSTAPSSDRVLQTLFLQNAVQVPPHSVQIAQSDPQSARSTLPTAGKSAVVPPASIPSRAESGAQKPLRLQGSAPEAAKPRKDATKKAAPQPETRNAKTINEANSGVVSVISGGADGTYIRIASDMATLLDDGSDLRVLPIVGRGSLQNIRDILFLRGVDIGIVQMDAREGLRKTHLYDEAVSQLRFIARLYNEEVHILAAKNITDISQLNGKKVNIDSEGTGTYLTSRVIFDKLGITPDFTMNDPVSALQNLKNGDIQAMIFVAGRPARLMSEFKPDERFHFIPVPFDEKLADVYLPSRLTASDYPQLITLGAPVDTLAVGNLLAVYNWPEKSERYNRVERFVSRFFSDFDEFVKPGRHPKWREVNLLADVPGWKRFKAAQNWIDKSDKNKSPIKLDMPEKSSLAPSQGPKSPDQNTLSSSVVTPPLPGGVTADDNLKLFLNERGLKDIPYNLAERRKTLQDFDEWKAARQKNPTR